MTTTLKLPTRPTLLTSPVFHAEMLCVVIGLTWGISFLMNKPLMGVMTPAALAFLRFGLASLVILALTGRSITAAQWRAVIKPGLITGSLLGMCYLMLNLGLAHTNSGKAALLIGSNAVMIPLFGYLFLRERVSPVVTACLGVTFVGLGLLSGATNLYIAPADLALLASAAFFSLQVVYSGRYGRQLSPYPLTIVQMATAAGVNLIAMLLTPGKLDFSALVTSPVLLLSLLTLAIPATALTYLGQLKVQKTVSSSRVGMIFLIDPVATALADKLVFNNNLTHVQLIGAALLMSGLILAGVVPGLLSRKRSQKAASVPQDTSSAQPRVPFADFSGGFVGMTGAPLLSYHVPVLGPDAAQRPLPAGQLIIEEDEHGHELHGSFALGAVPA